MSRVNRKRQKSSIQYFHSWITFKQLVRNAGYTRILYSKKRRRIAVENARQARLSK
jgi:ribosomal protein L17